MDTIIGYNSLKTITLCNHDVYVCVNIWIREDLYKLMKMFPSMIILKYCFLKWGVNAAKLERTLELQEEQRGVTLTYDIDIHVVIWCSNYS